jgi:hypothetical protein
LSNAKPPFVNYDGDHASESNAGSRSHPVDADNTRSQPVTNSAEIADKLRRREPPAYAAAATSSSIAVVVLYRGEFEMITGAQPVFGVGSINAVPA